MFEQIHALHRNFEKVPKSERYMLPYPMAVFGTLRTIPCDQGNSRLMTRVAPSKHCKAFLPHFTTEDISLRFEKNASAPLELFFYDPELWREMIGPVDRLEGFHPNKPLWGYVRTLVNVRLLPDDFAEDLFLEGLNNPSRDLKIPTKDWELYPSLPAWVYSNPAANKSANLISDSPVIWDGK